MYVFGALRKKIERLGKIIDAPENLLSGWEKKNQFARPYIELQFPFYYLVICENGREIERQRFPKVDMLLFAIFEIITFEMAIKYEAEHRILGQDCRRVLFSYQLELMGKLSSKWEKQLQDKFIRVLKRNSYHDNL